jgi:hypothetical protein
MSVSAHAATGAAVDGNDLAGIIDTFLLAADVGGDRPERSDARCGETHDTTIEERVT